jgi:hypothetical protein
LLSENWDFILIPLNKKKLKRLLNFPLVVLGGVLVIVLSAGPKVGGFKPSRGRWIFNGDKNP